MKSRIQANFQIWLVSVRNCGEFSSNIFKCEVGIEGNKNSINLTGVEPKSVNPMNSNEKKKY